jgi:lipopolysaccharide export LptBFGC system permease protein LptF
MDWPFGGGDDSDETSTKERLGTVVQVVTSLGAVLIGVIGLGWIDSALENLGTATSSVAAAFSFGLGLGVLAVATLLLCLALAFGVVAWYRLPDPPA